MRKTIAVLLVVFTSWYCQLGESKLKTGRNRNPGLTSKSHKHIPVSTVRSKSSICSVTFPTPTSTEQVLATKNISKDTDFGFKRFTAGPQVGGSIENERDHPILFLDDGVTISNVIIGKPASKGVWCRGSCTLINVWWGSTGTHAANFGASSNYWSNPNNKYVVKGGGVQNAADKVFIQQGAGTTYISNFFAQNCQKLWRACGDCNVQFQNRNLFITNTTVKGPMLRLGINDDLGDTFHLNGLNLCNSASIKYVCQAYKSNKNYNPVNSTNYSEHADEEISPGKPLNGCSCKDPHAKINIID